jgi:hypothetical protein
MGRWGFSLAALFCSALALGAAAPVGAKEGVKATLLAPVRVDAPAGTRITLRWRLGYRDAQGWHTFGGMGIFARLVSRSGSPPSSALARGVSGGYQATLRVPRGGMSRIQIGIHGSTDLLFPITNDPFRH